ncbi:MAG: ABC transporter permease [bacterium]
MFKKIFKYLFIKDAVTIDHANYLYKIKSRKITIRLLQIIMLISFFAIWELLGYYEVINTFLMSQPSKIYNLIIKMINTGELFQHIKVTLMENLTGFSIGTFFGTLISIILWWSDYLYKFLEPYLVILNSIPKVALGPVIIVWLGNDYRSIIVMAILVSVIVTIIMLTGGFREVEEDKIKLLKTLGANKKQILLKLILPASIPTIFSAVKVSIGLSLVGTIVGEYLVSRAGLGYLIVYGGQVFNLHMVMASIIILSIIAGIMYYLILLLENYIIKWK